MKNNKDFTNHNEKSNIDSQKVHSTRTTAGAAAYVEEHWYVQTRNIIYYILSIIEVLLAFRLIFKLLAANADNKFVSLIYSFSRALSVPFWGIFNTGTISSDGTQFVFEPAVIIAMIVYAIIAHGIVRLVRLKALRDPHK